MMCCPAHPRARQPHKTAQITELAMQRQSETPWWGIDIAGNCLVVSAGRPSFLHRSARMPTRPRREWSRYCDHSINNPHRERRQRERGGPCHDRPTSHRIVLRPVARTKQATGLRHPS